MGSQHTTIRVYLGIGRARSSNEAGEISIAPAVREAHHIPCLSFIPSPSSLSGNNPLPCINAEVQIR